VLYVIIVWFLKIDIIWRDISLYTEENNEHIRIILNKNQEIQYASIGREKAIDFIERKDVLSRLSDALPVEYDMGDYSVSIDNVKFSGSQKI